MSERTFGLAPSRAAPPGDRPFEISVLCRCGTRSSFVVEEQRSWRCDCGRGGFDVDSSWSIRHRGLLWISVSTAERA